MKSNFDLFAPIWEIYHLDLYKYLYSRMANQYDAEDVLQTTALNAARKFHKLKSPKVAKTWLFSIATNAMNDFYRNATIRKSHEAMLEIGVAAGEDTQEFSELKLTVSGYVDTLPPEKQNFFYLYMQKVLTLKEIADILNIGYSTARKWLVAIKEDLTEEIFDNVV